jgi:predicted outer membrane repeat protein
MTTLKSVSGLIIQLLLLLTAPLGAATIYVPEDHATIQGAIQAAASGDVIRVRSGTYTENIDFHGKQITVSSLEGPATTTIDASAQGAAVLFTSGEGPGSVLQGFTLTNGTGFFDEVELRTYGGGVYCYQSSPTIADCRIENNVADIGGGIGCETAAPDISGCVIQGNTADNGGGMYIRQADPRIRDCTFSANSALYIGGGMHCASASPTIAGCLFLQNETTSAAVGGGGGLSIIDSSPVIIDNEFQGNSTPMYGGGFRCTSGSHSSEPALVGNFFKDNTAQSGGAISCEDSGSVLITGNNFVLNLVTLYGGGIYSTDSGAVIRDNTFNRNQADEIGGGLYFISIPGPGSRAEIRNNLFEYNHAFEGGGFYTSGGELRLSGCRIYGNTAAFGGGAQVEDHDGGLVTGNAFYGNESTRGGGLMIHTSGELTLDGNTFAGNDADYGGAVYSTEDTMLTVVHSIFWGNTSPAGGAFYLDYDDPGLSLAIDYSDVEGGIGALVVETGCALTWGEGMIDADPLFVSGPGGDFYLSQTAAGQSENSPCVDTGDPEAGTAPGSTRTDAFSDGGIIDMGMHHTGGRLLAGAGPAESNPPLVRIFPLQQDAAPDLEFPAYGADHFGVNVHAGDLDGDGLDEIITGAGPGEIYGPHVRGFGPDGQPFPGVSFLAYGTNRFGVNAAAGDIDGDGRDEIITGAGPGEVFGPHVRAFEYIDAPPGTAAIPGVSFMAYGTLKYGVNVACGDIDGDGYDEIVTGAGPGAVFGPHVRGWNVDGGTAAAIPAVSFLAYGTPRFGVRVACGDLDGDGIDELVTAPGPSPTFGPHILGWNYDGNSVTPLAGCSFFALPQNEYSYGAQVFARADLDGDGRAELVVGAGPDEGADSKVAVYRYSGSAVSQWFTLRAMPAAWRHGATVAAGRF